MIDPSVLNKSIRDAIVLIMDDRSFLVLQGDQQAKRPSEPYATVKILDMQAMSLEGRLTVNEDADVNQHTQMAYRVMVGIKCFRDNAILNGLKIRKGLGRETVIDFLNEEKIGIAQRTNVRNETFALEYGFEERSGFNVYFNVVERDVETLTTIEEADVQGEYHSPSGRAETINFKIKE